MMHMSGNEKAISETSMLADLLAESSLLSRLLLKKSATSVIDPTIRSPLLSPPFHSPFWRPRPRPAVTARPCRPPALRHRPYWPTPSPPALAAGA
uniref:Uncharacterized protein n=1 Tax=Arundo donax TaxID=35708 RepID=A0A0A8YF19_ARUDO